MNLSKLVLSRVLIPEPRYTRFMLGFMLQPMARYALGHWPTRSIILDSHNMADIQDFMLQEVNFPPQNLRKQLGINLIRTLGTLQDDQKVL